MTVAPDFFQSSLAVDALFQSAQRLFNGLTFFEFNLCQSIFTSSPTTYKLGEPLICLTRLAGGLLIVEALGIMSNNTEKSFLFRFDSD